MRSRQWVLLRGLAREQAHWGDFKTRLQAADPHAEVLAIDLPGTGVYHELSCPNKMTGIAEFVQSHLKNPKPTERYLVAISLGAMVAVEMARLSPERFDGLVVINASFANLSPFYHRLQMQGMWHILKAAIAKTPEDREREVLAMVSNRQDVDAIVSEWAAIAKARPVSPKNFLMQLIAAMRYDLPAEKPQMPALVLTSDGDHMVSPECSRALADKWHAPLEVHPSGGHELCLDDPDWVIERITRFFSHVS